MGESSKPVMSSVPIQTDRDGTHSAASPDIGGQMVEPLVACQFLNRLTALGRPESYRIGQ